MANKAKPSHHGMAMDTGIKVKAAVTEFKPSANGSAVVRPSGSTKPVEGRATGNSKAGVSPKG
jgi:hypothetical protein